jgi:hypothetical protein
VRGKETVAGMKRKSQVLCVFFIATGLAGSAQKETYNWYFPLGGALNFSTSPPQPLANSSMTMISDPCGAISDANGNLLFYTNSQTVWDRNDNVMPNGSNLMTDFSDSQSGYIVQDPGNSHKYYIFNTRAAVQELRYNIVDMNLASGNGSVVAKNLLVSQLSEEALTSVGHANGVDSWIITHQYLTNNFRAHLLTSTGVSTAAVISSIGPILAQGGGAPNLKASPIRNRIGFAFNSQKCFGIAQINPATGVISNLLKLDTLDAGFTCEFSADGSKFYGISNSGHIIHQWDLCQPTDSAIVASQYTFTSVNSSDFGLQLAINGKIYAARGGSLLSVINEPNLVGSNCNYSPASQSIYPGSSAYFLPQFERRLLNSATGVFTYSTVPQSCGQYDFQASCMASKSYTSMSWNFGEPGSGTLNTSTLQIATHTYAANGQYKVKLILKTTTHTDTLWQTINVQNAPPTLTLSGKNTICKGETSTITVSGAFSYSWSGLGTNTVYVVSPSTTTVYTVSGTSTNNCTSVSNFSLKVDPCTQVEESEHLISLNLYPNPNNGRFSLEVSRGASFTIINLLGEVIQSGMVKDKIELDLKAHPAGLYWVMISSGGTNRRIVPVLFLAP